MTCAKVAINGPNLKKLAQKKNQIGKSGGERKKNPRANPGEDVVGRGGGTLNAYQILLFFAVVK